MVFTPESIMLGVGYLGIMQNSSFDVSDSIGKYGMVGIILNDLEFHRTEAARVWHRVDEEEDGSAVVDVGFAVSETPRHWRCRADAWSSTPAVPDLDSSALRRVCHVEGCCTVGGCRMRAHHLKCCQVSQDMHVSIFCLTCFQVVDCSAVSFAAWPQFQP